MIKSLLQKLQTQVVATVALAVCLSVGAVSTAFAFYNGLKLLLGDWGASAIVAFIFFAASAGLMLWLKDSHKPNPAEAERARSGVGAVVMELALAALTAYAATPRKKRRRD